MTLKELCKKKKNAFWVECKTVWWMCFSSAPIVFHIILSTIGLCTLFGRRRPCRLCIYYCYEVLEVHKNTREYANKSSHSCWFSAILIRNSLPLNSSYNYCFSLQNMTQTFPMEKYRNKERSFKFVPLYFTRFYFYSILLAWILCMNYKIILIAVLCCC